MFSLMLPMWFHFKLNMAPNINNIPESNNSINMKSKANKKIIQCVLCILENSESYMIL